MRLLSASDLLDIWERAAGDTPVEQALSILAAVLPQPQPALARWSIARRDAALFLLREQTFGAQFKGLADCPACGERLELAFAADDLRSAHILPVSELSLLDAEGTDVLQAVTSFQLNDYRVSVRPLTSLDLTGVAALPDVSQARRQLFEACLLSATHQEQAISAQELPADVMEAVIEQIGQAELLANLTVAFTCPACGHAWEVIFDIVSFFWSEINVWALRMLREVHVLASAYGWRE